MDERPADGRVGGVSGALRAALGSDAFLNALPIGIYCCDRDGIIRHFNRRAAELWGRAPQIGDGEQRFCGAFRLFYPDGAPLSHHESPMAAVLAAHEPARDRRVIIERPDGSRVTALVNIDPLFDETGAFAGAVNCFQDISALDLAEARRSETERRLRDTLDGLPVAIYTTDADGTITYCNEAAVQLSGRRPELGSDRWCVTWRLYHPDGRPMPHAESPMAQTLRQGKAVEAGELMAERPDGSRVFFVPYPKPLFDEQGRLTGAVNVLEDVSEGRNAALESAHLAAIVSSSDDAIVSKTLDGTIQSWNAGAERIFGYKDDEIVGKPITTIIPKELHEEEREILASLARGERVDHFETVRVAKDGRRLDISLTVSPVRDRSGRVVGASKIARDITEHKRAEEMQQLLFNELNHRVKNTLATVQSIARQSLRKAARPADFVTSFNGRVQALAKAHDLLVQERLRGSGISEIVRDQVLLGAPEGQRISCAGPQVKLDARMTVQLALVLHELATNARKYGALAVPRGHLAIIWKVETSTAGSELRLEWKESGVADVKAPESSGFGTTLVERSVQSCGGEITTDFGADGISCAIRLPLPREAQSGRHISVPPLGGESRFATDDGSPVELGGKRVAIIEDEPLVALEIETELEAVGCVIVGVALTLETARRLVDNEQLDAAVVDANLGGRPVDELAAVLTRKNVPFAFATGYGREALPAGFRDAPMLAKPFSPDQLIAMLKELLSSHAKSNVVRMHGG